MLMVFLTNWIATDALPYLENVVQLKPLRPPLSSWCSLGQLCADDARLKLYIFFPLFFKTKSETDLLVGKFDRQPLQPLQLLSPEGVYKH